MEIAKLRRLFDAARSESQDDVISKCVVCAKLGVTKLNRKSLCLRHYMMLEDEECLRAFLIEEATRG